MNTRCDAVENIAYRSLPLTYVVAYDGIAKDVTKRYANDFLQSSRNRDEEWWGSMLRMLRSAPKKLKENVAVESIHKACEAGWDTLCDPPVL